jgi:hypothetical protein
VLCIPLVSDSSWAKATPATDPVVLVSASASLFVAASLLWISLFSLSPLSSKATMISPVSLMSLPPSVLAPSAQQRSASSSVSPRMTMYVSLHTSCIAYTPSSNSVCPSSGGDAGGRRCIECEKFQIANEVLFDDFRSASSLSVVRFNLRVRARSHTQRLPRSNVWLLPSVCNTSVTASH